MGGGSDGINPTEHDLDELRDEVRQRLEQGQIDAEVNDLLLRELIAINERDVDAVNRYLERIEDALEDDVEGFERILFGGSVAKHTYVDGLSDVDSLVLLRDESLEDLRPADVLKQFEDTLLRKFPQGDVIETSVGKMAVTIKFSDGTEIQLLPALRSTDHVSVAAEDGESWSRIDPQAFAERLTDSNKNQGGAVVPAIKLVKAILRNKLGDEKPSGYHVEALAVEAFRDYTGPHTSKAMVTHLIESASRDVLQPISDPTGQSRHVDDALGDGGSAARQALATSLTAIAKTMTTSASLDDWRALLE